MPRSSVIAFALLIGFVVFVTIRGELPVYLGVVGIGTQANNVVMSSNANVGAPISLASSTPVLAQLPQLISL